MQRDLARRGRAAPAAARVGDGLGEVDLLAVTLALAGAAEHEQVVDRVRHAVELPEPRLEVAIGGRRVGARLLDPQPQAGERRAQLVRRVGHELGLRPQRAGEPLGHDVERAGERALLAAALDRRPRVDVAGGDLIGRRAEPLDRPGDPAREQVGGEQRGEQDREADRGDPDHGAADRVVDGVDALGEPHRADDAAPARTPGARWRGCPCRACRSAAGPGTAGRRARPPAPGGWRSRRRPPPASRCRRGPRRRRRRSRPAPAPPSRPPRRHRRAPACRGRRSIARRRPRARRPASGPWRAPRRRRGR